MAPIDIPDNIPTKKTLRLFRQAFKKWSVRRNIPGLPTRRTWPRRRGDTGTTEPSLN